MRYGYELFYSTGGHGGPYPTLKSARVRARALIQGNRDETWIRIFRTSTPAPGEMPVDTVRRRETPRKFADLWR